MQVRKVTEDDVGIRPLYEPPLGDESANNVPLVEYGCKRDSEDPPGHG